MSSVPSGYLPEFRGNDAQPGKTKIDLLHFSSSFNNTKDFGKEIGHSKKLHYPSLKASEISDYKEAIPADVNFQIPARNRLLSKSVLSKYAYKLQLK